MNAITGFVVREKGKPYDAGIRAMRGRLTVLLLAGWFLCLTGFAQAPLDVDRYGGLKSLSFTPGAFFRTHYDGQRWWLVTPEGGAFLSLGVCTVNPIGDTDRVTNKQPYRERVLEKYGSVENWTAATRDQLKSWGLNTLGGWSCGELRDSIPYTIVLSVGDGWGKGQVPDFFSEEVQERIRGQASGVDEFVNDPYLIGYYLNNEMPWSFDWRCFPNLFTGYAAMPPEAPGKKKLIEFFKERYQTPEHFNEVWQAGIKEWNDLSSPATLTSRDPVKAREDREAFVLLAARQYFKTATEALRAKDPNHLILGCRLVWALAPKPVVQACGEFCDVVSINYYEVGLVGGPLPSLTADSSMRIPTDLSFRPFYDVACKPLLITEFGFRAMDSGMPNTYPPGWLLQPTVPTQQIRAGKFEQCAVTWMSQPFFLGYHWFEYADEPQGGRNFDGENGNYGLVNINDEPYAEFIARFKAVNRRVWDLHAASGADTRN